MNDFARQLEAHYIELGPMLLAYFRRQAPLASSADDLVQETFLRAWRQRDRLRSVVSTRAYLYGIARHVGLDALRRRRPSEPLDGSIPSDAVVPNDDRAVLLRAVIERLPDIYREPLWLKLQQELSYTEIASVLGIPIGTVRSRLHYAIERLHLALNPPPEAKARLPRSDFIPKVP